MCNSAPLNPIPIAHLHYDIKSAKIVGSCSRPAETGPGEEDAGNTNAIVSIVSEINRYDTHVPGASIV